MLRVSSLSKSYSSAAALVDLSFELQPHEIVFLLGASGTGKTTALRCIANLDPFHSGSVTLDAQSPQQLGFARWRRHVMYVPQHRVALRGTPAELFTRVLSFHSYHDAKRTLPDYVRICASMALSRQNICCQQWSELSGGQAQRAIVALCVALRPQVLLLDEPSSSCDVQSTLKMEHAIKSSKIATVWVSHEAAQPRRVGGRVVNMLPHAN